MSVVVLGLGMCGKLSLQALLQFMYCTYGIFSMVLVKYSVQCCCLLYQYFIYLLFMLSMLILSNSVMCSDSYPIPILSLFFLYHPFSSI